jgi:hypothetical protein
MHAFDQFALNLLEQSKRFLEKAKEDPGADGKSAYLNASLNLSFCALEAYVNLISDEFLLRTDLGLADQSILAEKEIKLTHGVHSLGSLKMYRLEDRIQFLRARFGGEPLDRTQPWWTALAQAIDLRNSLTHPKNVPGVTESAVQRAIESVVSVLDDLYQSIYKTPYPGVRRGLQSRLKF